MAWALGPTSLAAPHAPGGLLPVPGVCHNPPSLRTLARAGPIFYKSPLCLLCPQTLLILLPPRSGALPAPPCPRLPPALQSAAGAPLAPFASLPSASLMAGTLCRAIRDPERGADPGRTGRGRRVRPAVGGCRGGAAGGAQRGRPGLRVGIWLPGTPPRPLNTLRRRSHVLPGPHLTVHVLPGPTPHRHL